MRDLRIRRTVRKLTCACASAQLLRPLRSWVSQFWRRGLDLLPSSAMLMTCRHLPGLMSMTPLRPNRSLWGRAGRRWGAVDGVVVVPTGPLLLLGLDAVVMRQSPPLGTMWKLAESSKLAVCGWWERCSSLGDCGASSRRRWADRRCWANRRWARSPSPKHADLRHHLGSARVSERDEKEETTDVVLLF